MIDVKKLITGFLILAVAIGTSALLVSFVTGSSSNANANDQTAMALGTEQPSSTPVGDNAFLAQNAPSDDQGSPTIVTPNPDDAITTSSDPDEDPNNLTDLFADSYLGGIIGANPSGPGVDANGNPAFTPPDPYGIANVVAEASATQELQIPNWDTEAASQPILIATSSNPASITAYDEALNDVTNNHFNSQVQAILNDPDTADMDDLSYIGTQMQEALGDTLALETPPSLVHFQKDFVKILVYDKNFFQLLTLAQTDPVKASLIFQAEDTQFDLAQQEFAADSQEIASGTVSIQDNTPPPNKLVAMVDSALGIPTAHAQLTVFDPTTWSLIWTNQATNIEHQLENTIRNTLLQILKNTLIAVIQRKVLVWIQGSGAPRFVTSWATQLVNAYTQTALSAINSAFSCTYAGFSPQLKLTLKVGYNSQGSVCANSFAAALAGNSFQQFQNNFKNGSWLAFGASTMPSNNYYGSLFFGAQIVDYNGQQARNASQAKSVASQGAKGDQVCADGSNPNGLSYVCIDPSGNPHFQNTPCPTGNGWQSEASANNGVCANGAEPQGTTPGIFTVNSENVAGGGTTQQLAAANSIVGLLNAVAGSLITGLANAAVSAAGNAVNGILSVNPTSIQGGGTPPAQTALTCTPSTQTIQMIASTTPPTTIAAAGGTYDANGDFPTYNWVSSDGATSTGSTFTHTFSPGTYNPLTGYAASTYTVTLSDSAGDASTTCTVTVQ